MPLFNENSITRIYANGAKADELYIKYLYKKTSMKIIKLPSTSPNKGNLKIYNNKKVIGLKNTLYPGTTSPVLKIRPLLIHTKFRHKTFHM